MRCFVFTIYGLTNHKNQIILCTYMCAHMGLEIQDHEDGHDCGPACRGNVLVEGRISHQMMFLLSAGENM